MKRYLDMTTAICEKIDEFQCVLLGLTLWNLAGLFCCSRPLMFGFVGLSFTRLVSYHVLNIEDKLSVARLLRTVDHSIGFM